MLGIRATVNESDVSTLLLLTLDKLYFLDCHSSTLQQHFNIEHIQLERQETSQSSCTGGLVEVHLLSHPSKPVHVVDQADTSSFQAVENYLKLSQLEAQQVELPITASGSGDELDDNSHDYGRSQQGDVERCSSNIVFLVNEQEATQFLSMFESVRDHIREPELSFCVYNTIISTSKKEEESFFSATSQQN